ncbi:MAG: hypothetical protein H7323_01465, partial [Frankiales bacterium]|nr:hypothetical protein [Frankiales bacterium]
MTAATQLTSAAMPTVQDLRSDTLEHRFGDLWNPPGLTNFLGCAQADLDPVAVRSISFPPLATGDLVTGTLFLDDRLFTALGVSLSTPVLPTDWTIEGASLLFDHSQNVYKEGKRSAALSGALGGG